MRKVVSSVVGDARFSGHIRWTDTAPGGVGVSSGPGARAAVVNVSVERVGVGSVWHEVGRATCWTLDPLLHQRRCRRRRDQRTSQKIREGSSAERNIALKMTLIPQLAGPYPLAMPLDERRLLAVCLVMKPNLLKQQASSVHACTWPRWSTHSMPPADKTC